MVALELTRTPINSVMIQKLRNSELNGMIRSRSDLGLASTVTKMLMEQSSNAILPGNLKTIRGEQSPSKIQTEDLEPTITPINSVMIQKFKSLVSDVRKGYP
jgi:hypothetical protein